MAERSTPSDKILVDSMFVVPEGSEDQFVYTREESEDYSDADDLSFDEFGNIDTDYFDDGYDDKDADTLQVPEDFVIVSQTLRRAPGGQQVVDIVIEAEDVPRAINYEIQVTKI